MGSSLTVPQGQAGSRLLSVDLPCLGVVFFHDPRSLLPSLCPTRVSATLGLIPRILTLLLEQPSSEDLWRAPQESPRYLACGCPARPWPAYRLWLRRIMELPTEEYITRHEHSTPVSASEFLFTVLCYLDRHLRTDSCHSQAVCCTHIPSQPHNPKEGHAN